MQTPPLLPTAKLRRALGIAKADGWSVVIVAGLSAVISLLDGSFGFAATAALVVLAGFAELHGRRLLLAERRSGTAWLVGAQLALLAIILVYVRYRLQHFDADEIWRRLPGFAQEQLREQFAASGLDPDTDRVTLLNLMNQAVCWGLAIVTLLYQGGLALYYLRRGRLDGEPILRA